ncbi:hypothetical protein KP509_25G027100 [Ceratopteris richardii]|uniref:K Homology domain-containing protein n=1 Tax=Ceratopteris richardii TaxID=49495 RepID=A0A8T2RRB8_CERRI|nr:hypothetical protein KP509_25G027100 [Ceratopteris richardii]KAH7298106.1 hypothetical protein KP509_25G027100 [Ceratopteris richardii]KAH7298107.1 hypothetical protein KP509_25G027100 [Ceratopteris richardii]KAH7298108.1 hypothetical protein KP509_25G027100 [Ceratopteris richardii]KAH7298109.1 hypothetical protein KP509_25G027100 [Ceratopteris richardii]
MDVDGRLSSSVKRSHPPNDDESAERSERQSKRKVLSADSAPPETEYRILCPAERIGNLIGKGGSIIKSLRQECRSKIRVEDPIPGSDERVIYICSASKEKHRDEGAEVHSLCPAQEALFRVHSRIVEIGAMDDDEDEPPRPVTARLLVPNVQIGCVIGKGGKIIEQMRREIGAQIRVLPKEQMPPWVSNSEEIVQLSGDPALVRKALKAVSSRLYENPPRDRAVGASVEGFYMPQGHMPTVAYGPLYSSGSFMHQGAPLITPMNMGGSLMGVGAFYGAAGYGNAWSTVAFPSSYGASGGGDVGGFEDVGKEELVLRMLCPKDKVGSLIGKGGSIIQKMREDTGAHIRVGDPMPNADERVVEITSSEFAESLSSSGVEAALQVHNRLMEMMSDKETCIARLLVPANQIGCILGKGGSIITEIRKSTHANIRIPSKEELPKCASENDELVQITGDETTVMEALSEVLNRLRSNALRGGNPAQQKANAPVPGVTYPGGPLPVAYGMRYGKGSYGGFYPVSNMNYQGIRYGGSFGQEQGIPVTKRESKRR